MNDFTINSILPFFYKTNPFHVVMGLFSKRSQMSKCGEKISETLCTFCGMKKVLLSLMQFIFRIREEFFQSDDNSTIPTHHFLHGLIDVCRNL